MSYTLDIIATSDTYQELLCPGSQNVTAQVSNAAIYIGFGTALGATRTGNVTYPPADEVLLPSFAGLDRDCDAIRIKSYKLATPANVKLTAH